MSHASDEELVLLAYGEETSASRHVVGCARCRTRVARMRDFLMSLEETPVPERDEAYGRDVWRRLAPRLTESTARRAGLFTAGNLLRAAAVVALVAAAFVIGRITPRPAPPLTASVRERILLSAVGDHLERSQAVLLDFVHADPSAEIPGPARRRAQDLATDNRLIRQIAARAGDAAVAGVLDDLERILLEIADGASTSQARATLARRIDSEEVLFKVRVLDARVRAREDAPQAGERRL